MFLNRFSRLSNPTFCVSNSYPKQGTNVCLIRYSIYSTLKTLPIVEEVDLWFCRSLGNSKAFLFVPSVPRSPVLRMAFDTSDVSGGPCVIEWSSWRMLPWWGFQVGCWTSPKIRRETKNAKSQVNESTHFVCFLGLFSGNWKCFLYAWMLFENNENWNKAISNFYLLISILLRNQNKRHPFGIM